MRLDHYDKAVGEISKNSSGLFDSRDSLADVIVPNHWNKHKVIEICLLERKD